jgi:CRISPR-associated endonuclease/helicase Cas3
MPAFSKRSGFTQGIDKIEHLIEEPERYYIKRVKYSFVNELRTVPMEKLLSLFKKQSRSTLAVLNTKKDALELFTKIGGEWDERFHLSTSMFPRHRKIILKRIRKSLKSGRKILVVTTQLIEAGVDLDFPTVFRALGPLDSIIQAAGRCNREGNDNKGDVYIFNLEGAGMPVDSCYRAASDYVEHFLENKKKDGLLTDQIMHSTGIFEEYFDGLIKLFINTDKANIEDSRKALRFEEVADKYHIIDNVTKPVFVKCFQQEGKISLIRKAQNIYKNIKNKPFLSIEDYRKLQPYFVQLYSNGLKKAASSIDTLSNGLLVWEGFYSNKTGLGEPGFEDLIV